jgi:hypothetical protein
MGERRTTTALTRSLAVLAGLSLAATAQSPANLTYQNRGRYSEGVRTAPSTGPDLDLIAALVDHREPYSVLPPSFRALFYAPNSEQIYLTIREIEARYYYWLDNVQEPGWHAGKSNQFEWPTATVIRSLKWQQDALGLDDLGAVARLGRPTPSIAETVAPVALYHSRPPQLIEGYRFIFLPGERMRLRFQVVAEGKNAPLTSETFPVVLAKQPHPVMWKTAQWPDGWYRLDISGYALSNNDSISRKVRFYHSRRLGN